MFLPKYSQGAAKQISHSTAGGAGLPFENVTPYLHASWKPVSSKGGKLFQKSALLILTFHESRQLNKGRLEVAFQRRIRALAWDWSRSKLPSLPKTQPWHTMPHSCTQTETWHSTGVLLFRQSHGRRKSLGRHTTKRSFKGIHFPISAPRPKCTFLFIELPLQWPLQSEGSIPASLAFVATWQQSWTPRKAGSFYSPPLLLSS